MSESPPRQPRYILDVHLGKLAGYLRMLGFDTLYSNRYGDHEIVRIAAKQKQIILRRDVGIQKMRDVTRGYWIRSHHPKEQLREVVDYFDLYSCITPFHRCMRCNGTIRKVEKKAVSNDIGEDIRSSRRPWRPPGHS
jgi:hypothetical protein